MLVLFCTPELKYSIQLFIIWKSSLIDFILTITPWACTYIKHSPTGAKPLTRIKCKILDLLQINCKTKRVCKAFKFRSKNNIKSVTINYWFKTLRKHISFLTFKYVTFFKFTSLRFVDICNYLKNEKWRGCVVVKMKGSGGGILTGKRIIEICSYNFIN